ncbi:hypothetical protein WMO33_13985 [Xanthomonas oryzae pv. oryzicola]|nr:hypothetical protein [Xanthomonas oryzae]
MRTGPVPGVCVRGLQGFGTRESDSGDTDAQWAATDRPACRHTAIHTHANFVIDDSVLAQLRQATASGEKHLRWFENEVHHRDGEVIARVRKQLYVKRKPAR